MFTKAVFVRSVISIFGIQRVKKYIFLGVFTVRARCWKLRFLCFCLLFAFFRTPKKLTLDTLYCARVFGRVLIAIYNARAPSDSPGLGVVHFSESHDRYLHDFGPLGVTGPRRSALFERPDRYLHDFGPFGVTKPRRGAPREANLSIAVQTGALTAHPESAPDGPFER